MRTGAHRHGVARCAASLRKQLESQPNVRMILPATVREARVFTGVSLTGGIYEEVLYRGNLLWYLQFIWFRKERQGQ
jgi:hypothetical protein